MMSRKKRPFSKSARVFTLLLFMSTLVFQPGQGMSHKTSSSNRRTKGSSPASEDLPIYLPIISRQCYIQFFDDFSDPTSGWPTDGLPLTTYWEGEYLIHVSSDDRWGIGAASAPIGQISDYLVTVDARKELGMGFFGLHFDTDVDGGYFYQISDAGAYSIYRKEVDWNSATGWSYTNLAGGTSPALIVGGVNTIAIERTGVEIRAFANGELIADLQDDTFNRPGVAGLYISSFGYTTLQAFFDNFKVEPSGCGWSSGSGLFPPGEHR